MALRKHNSEDTTSLDMGSLNFKIPKRDVGREPNPNPNPNPGPNVDIDMREVYFMIMHLLSYGPCKQSFAQLSNELREHRLLPRRYHAWFSRNGEPSGIEDDDGISLPLCYTNLTDRYPHIGRDHLIKLLKQLIQSSSAPLNGLVGGPTCNAADVPTLLGSGSFSLLASDRYKEEKEAIKLPGHLRWPHMHADQIRGLSLREIGGGFAKHHRAPSVRAACYAIAKPSTLVQKMQIIKKLRGHQNAVYCATFDRSGRFVITGSDDRLVKIWSMETALCLSSCRGHEGDITDLAVSSNNALVASSSNDFIIRVWRLPDGLPISVLKGHTSAVTAIAFSPRPSAVYQLLSSSDDGTCRIWDARYSQQSLHVYVPKPPENPTVKIGEPSTSSAMPPIQQTHQILCCAFNANGTVFVTGSSDTYARVWNACRFATEESSEPIHEMDLLSGHENDVNYVQFSGCAIPSRSVSGEITKEDNLPKFKNSWFTHDNIVTCSRDGSAIIWVPRSRRSHGKVGRWTRAYHLKVPPPPMAPQPTRGGPRQRFQPTPRGVNMIVWSLDNRFVLAAIMDCRICVWNASDGSLVHSLIGHKASTFVLDVHPFNPRIAMSAGYDGKTIIWDIWEGKPVQIYETGQFKLVDGKFSPDGTSIILSDEVGQIFIIATGQGESQKDAKYDQFFLGDYRPLARDAANGNVLDQETQLQPYRRNMQDLLCDSTMIPYPEPYQSMYQRRRLGTLGIEWRPPSVNFAVGPTYNATTGEFQMLPVIDLERWAEPLPEIADVIDWEQQVVEGQTDEDLSDSEYNLTDEYESEGEEQEILSINSSDESEYSDDVDAGVANPSAGKAGLRRSRRKNHKSEAELVTSSGRRVKRRNLEEPEEPMAVGQSRAHKTRKSKHVVRVGPRKKSPKSRDLRPQRLAARNALSLFSKITGASSDAEEDEEEGEEDSESSYSESDSMIPELKGKESQSSSMLSYELKKHVQEREGYTQNGGTTYQTGRRLILKLPHRNSNVVNALETVKEESLKNEVASTSAIITEPKQEALPEPKVESKTVLGPELESKPEGELNYDEFAMEEAEPQTGRSSCGTESEELGTPLVAHSSKIRWGKVNQRSSSKRPKVPEDSGPTNENKPAADTITSTNVEESRGIDEDMESKAVPDGGMSIGTKQQAGSSSQPIIYKRLKVKARDLGNRMPKIEDKLANTQHDIASIKIDNNRLSEETGVEANSKVPVVYTRSRPSKKRKPDDNEYDIEESTSNSNHSRDDADYDAAADEGSHHGTRLRERSLRSRHNNTYYEASTSGRRSQLERQARMGSNDWTSPSKSGINLRPARNRREVSGYIEPRQFDRRNQLARKLSWLMLLEHEDSYRYIPQKGDEVAYLRQGHEEYSKGFRRSNEKIPSEIMPDLKAVEFCKVHSLDYSTFRGSGEGCCKLALEFTDPDSSAFHMVFKVTLPELVTFPDFLVERTRYETSIDRNWTHRDKCLVWWRNEDGESGSWWEGRIMAVKPKSPDFPNSPWERYVIQYKNDASEQHSHSPWELQDVDEQWAHPHIDIRTRDRLLSAISELEQASMRKDYYGIQKINMVVQKAEFINRFPVQISIEVIKKRLENNYYRTIEAVKNDASTMVYFSELYFGKTGDLASRMHRLSEWIENLFNEL